MSETLTRAEAPSLVEPPTGHIDDFNFFIGDWKTRHHQLVGRLVGSTTWRDFGGVSQVRKIMGGQGNLDDNILDLPTGAYRAATVRTFDPASRHWSIYWIDARFVGIEPPMVGGFDGPHGLLFAEEVQEGRPVVVRFRWTVLDADHCRWEQAFTEDRGLTWEINWTTEFERSAEPVL